MDMEENHVGVIKQLKGIVTKQARGSIWQKRSTITLSEAERTTKNICDISMKTHSVGIATNYTQMNKGYGHSPMPL